MEEYHLIEEDISNKDYFENIRDMVICTICLNIMEDPIQCNICQHSFCLECINKLSKCPMGCQNYQFKDSSLCKELLSGIKIKCIKCGEEINYDNIQNHMEEDCKNIDYKQKYLNLKIEYLKLKDKVDNPGENYEVEGIGSIKSYVHNHPLHIMRHFEREICILLPVNCPVRQLSAQISKVLILAKKNLVKVPTLENLRGQLTDRTVHGQ